MTVEPIMTQKEVYVCPSCGKRFFADWMYRSHCRQVDPKRRQANENLVGRLVKEDIGWGVCYAQVSSMDPCTGILKGHCVTASGPYSDPIMVGYRAWESDPGAFIVPCDSFDGARSDFIGYAVRTILGRIDFDRCRPYMTDIPEDDFPVEPIMEYEPAFGCPICGAKFRTEDLCIRHIRECDSEEGNLKRVFKEACVSSFPKDPFFYGVVRDVEPHFGVAEVNGYRISLAWGISVEKVETDIRLDDIHVIDPEDVPSELSDRLAREVGAIFDRLSGVYE